MGFMGNNFLKNRYRLFKNSTIIDAAGTRKADILIDPEGRIVKISQHIDISNHIEPQAMLDTVDLNGNIVVTPFVDMHCHLRYPGSISESLMSGSRAAVKGGFEYLLAMPNTEPCSDNKKVIEDVKSVISSTETYGVNIGLAGSLTVGRNGRELTDIEELAEYGVRYFTDDGSGLQDAKLMKQAVEILENSECIIGQHLESISNSLDGVMNLGDTSTKLGLKGIDRTWEIEMLERDLSILKSKNTRYHAMHISVKESAEIVHKSKVSGINITCEVTPHHLFFDETELLSLNPNFKVNPPLRCLNDVLYLRKKLNEIIDVIATDHAPHRSVKKELPIEEAPFGMLGLQSSFAAVFTALTQAKRPRELLGCLDILSIIVEKMSLNPRRILNLGGLEIEEGKLANFVVINPLKTICQTVSDIESDSINSPYLNKELLGEVGIVVLNGDFKVDDGKIVT
jgi:dihydroorotase